MTSRKIAFMGTPDFAVPALKKLIGSAHEVVAVYTAPPRPAGRGQALKKSKIHELAEANSITVFTPANLRNENLVECDVAVVAAYGVLLPKHILNAPKFGCINIHPSLLPRWRGAAPIQRTIMAGDKETAVCIMQMDEGLDTGGILLQQSFALSAEITAGELHDKCAEIGAEMVLHVIDDIENLKADKQNTEGVTYAKKITREDEKITWHQTAVEINDKIRGLSPYPGAFFEYGKEKFKIFAAEVSDQSLKPGEVADGLMIGCGKGSVIIKRLQRPGKKPVSAEEFTRGFKIPPGTILQ